MRYSNRVFLYAPLLVLLIIATAAMIRWEQLAHQWETRLLAANRGAQIAPGVTLHFASEQIGGFPFNLDVVLNRVVIAVQSTRCPILLASERFAIHALTYGRAQQVMEAAGPQTITWTDAEGAMYRFAFLPGAMRASAIERDGRLARFDLDLSEFGSRALTGARAQLHIRASPERDAVDFAIRAADLRGKSSNTVLSNIEIAGRITPAAPLSPLLFARDEWRNTLNRWRGANGLLRLDTIKIGWDASRLAGSGLLSLDQSHRIRGEVTMQLSAAEPWKPTQLVQSPFTSALQELANASPRESAAPRLLSLDIHNGAAIVRTAGQSRAAGSIDSIF
jgi:hypothetical protein